MSIIQCAKNCQHQENGYCMLEKISVITNTLGGCPHYLLKDLDNSVSKTSNGHQFDTEI